MACLPLRVFGAAAAAALAAAQQAGQLTAGDIDDNLNFELYLGYKSRALSKLQEHQNQQSTSLPNPNLEGRVVVNVTDQSGAPFSCAIVEVPDLQLTLPAGTNGLLSLFPAIDGLAGSSVQVRARDPAGSCPASCSALTSLGSGGELSLQIPVQAALPAQMDVAFVVDTTGSMCDELNYLQAEISTIFSNVQSQAQRSVDTRVANILYRDTGDEYVVETTQFGPSGSQGPAVVALKQGTCGGGGDYPEAMDKAMSASLQLQWRSGNTARVAFLIADAPPHDHSLQATLDSALALRAAGVKVYGLAASGVGDTAEYLMRLMALVTGARHLWLTDDSGIGGSHQEPKVKCYQVTRLDRLLERVLQSELSGARVEAFPSHIIREVGRQERGVCIVDFQPETTTTMASTTEDFGDSGDGDSGEKVSAGGDVSMDSKESASSAPLARPAWALAVLAAAAALPWIA